jgi:hypothetical protein
MGYLPYHVLVNEQALKLVLEAAEGMIAEAEGLRDSETFISKTQDAITRIKQDIEWSRDHRCKACHGAGMGNDGDSWDPSDICTACGGLGIRQVEE